MVVILILPSSDEQPHQHQPQHQHHHHQQTPPPTSSISINGCDPFRLNEAPRIISNSNNSTHQHQHQQQQQHEYHHRKRRSAPKRITFETDLINHRSPPPPAASGALPSAAAYTATTTTTTSKRDRVRHITRVNISDVYSQVEIDGDAEPVTKEGKPKIMLSFCSHFHSFITFAFAQNSLQF